MARRSFFKIVLASVLISLFVGFPVFAESPSGIEIVKLMDDGAGGLQPWVDITDALPGVIYSLVPRVQNHSSVSVRIKMCLSESIINAAGEAISLPANAFVANINENWTADDSNCYNYREALGSGAISEPLFSEISLSPLVANEHQGANFSLVLDAFAIEDLPDEPGGTDDTNAAGTDGETTETELDGGTMAETGGTSQNNQNGTSSTSSGKSSLGSPDTGLPAGSASLVAPAALFLTLGAVVLIGMTICLVKNSVRKDV